MPRKIIITFIKPPIPTRLWDWIAYRDGDEELGEYGYGPTAQDAINDLITNYPERREVS